MSKMVIFDQAMCCSTGICGVGVDSELLRISAAINKLTEKGIVVERYNPNTAPEEFISNNTVNKLINDNGINELPITLIDNQVVKTGAYLTNDELVNAFNLPHGFFQGINSKCCCNNKGCK
ncbi:MAG: arsenite efflux transporter metallochaperone ArsD [Clostridium sp.]|uniref:arsenite efflux transporter metallochaperone ArsD n=1 Tax=Clostridium sp. TaxID=1506 RepID=UPI003F2A7830